MFERFTERARQVVVLAQDEARRLRHNYIGTEHLLLGLLREEEGLAARVLESLDITVEEVRAQVARIVGQGDEIMTSQIPFTPRAKKVLELGMQEALALGHNYIGTEHLLLGLVRENEGVASRVLLDFDADADTIRNKVIRMLTGPRRAHIAPGPVTAVEQYTPQSPPFAEEVLRELDRVRSEKEEAIENHDLERAAKLRDRERRLRASAKRFERAWRDEPDPIEASEPMWSPTPPSSWVWRYVFGLGWMLFGVAAALGVLAGWLIWG